MAAWRRNKLSYGERYGGIVEVALATTNTGSGQDSGQDSADNAQATTTTTIRLTQSEEPDSTVWDASVVLAHHLSIAEQQQQQEQEQHRGATVVKGKRVLELGAGCALAGIAAAALGASQVVVTDMDEYRELIKGNVRNSSLTEEAARRIVVQELMWGDPKQQAACKGPFDVILASDCIYAVQSLSALVTTLLALSDYNTRILIAFEHRWKDVEEYFTSLVTPFFSLYTVPADQQHPVYSAPDDIVILLLQKLPGVDDD